MKKIGRMSKLDIWLPHTLSEKNKEDRIAIEIGLLSRQRNYQFLKNIITGNEKWIFYNNFQHKKQWLDKDEILQHILKAKLHDRKVMRHVYGGITEVLFILTF